jgi:hypothetical protein
VADLSVHLDGIMKENLLNSKQKVLEYLFEKILDISMRETGRVIFQMEKVRNFGRSTEKVLSIKANL